MAILVPGWSRAGPWLNLSKNFGGFNLFFNTCGTFTYNETEKKITIKMFLLSLYLLEIINRKLDCMLGSQPNHGWQLYFPL